MIEELYSKIICKIVNRETSVYDVVYFYGNHNAVPTLLDAIVETHHKQSPNRSIVRLDATCFYSQAFLNALTDGVGITGNCVYIVENIDMVAGREMAQQCVYSFFDSILESGGQLIVSGKGPVATIEKLAMRICAQIEGGISFEVKSGREFEK